MIAKLRSVISVILPTSSNADGLRRALRGLRAQRDASWEAIVMDNGAGEGLAVVKGIGDGRIRAYRNPGQGLIAARNAGLEVAKGAVIAWLCDGDHWLDPYWLTRICQALKHGEALTHGGGQLRRVDDDLEPQPYAPSVTLESLRHSNPILVSGVAYPAVMHDWLGDFDTSLGVAWDWDWHLRVTAAGVPLRLIDGSSVSARVPNPLPNPATSARDLALLAQKHGLRDLKATNLWEVALEGQRNTELIAAD